MPWTWCDNYVNMLYIYRSDIKVYKLNENDAN